MSLEVYSVWGSAQEDVCHPDQIEDKNPFQREESSPASFRSEEPRPGDEDSGEVEEKPGEGGRVGRVGEDPDQKWDEEYHLLVRDCTRVDEISKESDKSQEF